MRAIFHLNVTELAPHHAFWVETLGGCLSDSHTIEFPLAQLRLAINPPTGGTKGTPLDHIAFAVPNVHDAVTLARAGGHPLITRAELSPALDVVDDVAFVAPLETSVAFTMGPDDVKVEFYEVADAEAIALHHVHFFSPDPERMKQWYAKLFGVAPADRGPFHAGDSPNGFNLSFSQSPPVVPTKGRAVDRIGFESDEAARTPARSLVDPWGTTIEIG